MSSTRVDPRLARRRRQVKEEAARGHVARSTLILLGIASLAAAVWLLQSPLLAVERLEVAGEEHAGVEEALAAAGIRVGMPLVAVRPGRVERAVESDPWVADARVTLVFPDTVEVAVVERAPAAVAPIDGQWMLVSDDGVVLGSGAEQDADLAVLGTDLGPLHPGDAVTGEASAALGFLNSLPEELRAGAEVRWDGGQLWAVVSGRQVRLGEPFDLEAKAAAVTALLREGVPEGAHMDVLAPSRPAVDQP